MIVQITGLKTICLKSESLAELCLVVPILCLSVPIGFVLLQMHLQLIVLVVDLWASCTIKAMLLLEVPLGTRRRTSNALQVLSSFPLWMRETGNTCIHKLTAKTNQASVLCELKVRKRCVFDGRPPCRETEMDPYTSRSCPGLYLYCTHIGKRVLPFCRCPIVIDRWTIVGTGCWPPGIRHPLVGGLVAVMSGRLSKP